jgi:holo-[acyl-carrier protein] synthase
MIGGIGTDIVAIRRITECMRKYGDHFLRKVFTDPEIEHCKGTAAPEVHFAGRWAGKEAFFKALPMACQAVSSWKSIEVLALEGGGKPVVHVCGDDLRNRLAGEGVSSIHISISHDQEYCLAFVVIEFRPDD